MAIISRILFEQGLHLKKLWEANWDMLEGVCPKCGTHYFGWALTQRQHQTCPKCGAVLKIEYNCRQDAKSQLSANGRTIIDITPDNNQSDDQGED